MNKPKTIELLDKIDWTEIDRMSQFECNLSDEDFFTAVITRCRHSDDNPNTTMYSLIFEATVDEICVETFFPTNCYSDIDNVVGLFWAVSCEMRIRGIPLFPIIFLQDWADNYDEMLGTQRGILWGNLSINKTIEEFEKYYTPGVPFEQLEQENQESEATMH